MQDDQLVVRLPDGSTRLLNGAVELDAPTVGGLRRWAAAGAGLPSPSLLRLKCGPRELASDGAPCFEAARAGVVHALLRLPGGTHPMDAMCKEYPADPQRAILLKNKNRELAEKSRAEAAAQVNSLLKKKLDAARFDAYPEASTSAASASDAEYKAKLEKQRRKLMEGGSDSDSSLSVFDPNMGK